MSNEFTTTQENIATSGSNRDSSIDEIFFDAEMNLNDNHNKTTPNSFHQYSNTIYNRNNNTIYNNNESSTSEYLTANSSDGCHESSPFVEASGMNLLDDHYKNEKEQKQPFSSVPNTSPTSGITVEVPIVEPTAGPVTASYPNNILEDYDDVHSVASESVASFNPDDIEYRDGLPTGIQFALSPKKEHRKLRSLRALWDKFAAQTALTVAVASIFTLIPRIFDNVPIESLWIAIAAVLACETKYGASLVVGAQKIIGALVAGLIGTALTVGISYLPPQNCLSCSYKPAIFCFCIVIFIYFSTLFRQRYQYVAYFNRVTNVTFLGILLASIQLETIFNKEEPLTQEFGPRIAIDNLIRTGFVLLGIALAIFGTVFFFPMRQYRAHRLQIADVMANMSQLLEKTLFLGYLDPSMTEETLDNHKPHSFTVVDMMQNRGSSESNLSEVVSRAGSVYEVDEIVYAPPKAKSNLPPPSSSSPENAIVEIHLGRRRYDPNNKTKSNQNIIRNNIHAVSFGRNKTLDNVQTKRINKNPQNNKDYEDDEVVETNSPEQKWTKNLLQNNITSPALDSLYAKKVQEIKNKLSKPHHQFKMKIHPFAVRVIRTLEKERARYEISATKEFVIFDDPHVIVMAPMEKIVRQLRSLYYDLIALYSDRIAFFRLLSSKQVFMDNNAVKELYRDLSDLGEQWVLEWLKDNCMLNLHCQQYRTGTYCLEVMVRHMSRFLSGLSHIVLLSTAKTPQVTTVELQTRLAIQRDALEEQVLKAIDKELFYAYRQLNFSAKIAPVPSPTKTYTSSAATPSSSQTISPFSSSNTATNTPYSSHEALERTPTSPSTANVNTNATSPFTTKVLPTKSSILALKYNLLIRLRHIALNLLEINESVIRMIAR